VVLASRDQPIKEDEKMADFVDELREFGAPRILELGARRSNPESSTMQKKHYPFASEYIGTDIQPGIDVDVLSDVHSLSQTFGEESFDAIISFSVMEHVKYPFLAAHEMLKTLRVGGHAFIMTHFAFAEHGHPHDYFRYTLDGLAALFPQTMGVEVRWTGYDYPCEIISERLGSDPGMSGFLNSHVWLTKRSATPDDFRYELDNLVP
jgi:SAM-dependent methyltransferase